MQLTITLSHRTLMIQKANKAKHSENLLAVAPKFPVLAALYTLIYFWRDHETKEGNHP